MRPNPTDGRSKLVMLTDTGRAFRTDAIGSLQPDMAALADKLNITMIADPTPKLAQIRKILDENRRDEP